jgi:hypothetical protein
MTKTYTLQCADFKRILSGYLSTLNLIERTADRMTAVKGLMGYSEKTKGSVNFKKKSESNRPHDKYMPNRAVSVQEVENIVLNNLILTA